MKLVYEFIGTFFLVFTVGMTVLNPGGAGAFAGLAIGTILAVMIYAGAHVSGGHYNPAVSLAVFLRGKLPASELLNYWAAQLVAGVAASYLAVYLKGAHQEMPLALDAGKTFIAEFLFTFALAFVVLNVATASKNAGNSFYGWAIGFTVLAGAYAVGSISGAAFNPAVALGASLMNMITWADLGVFVAAQLIGAAVAAYTFKAAHPIE